MNRITIKDVAIKTGYSVATVSKALSKRGVVSDETREYIRSTAISMGYRYNSVAQSLSRKEVIIGVVRPREWPQFYGQIYNGIMFELESLMDFNVSNITVECEDGISDDELAAKIAELLDLGVHAVVLCTDVANDYSKAVEKLRNSKTPFAEVGNSFLGSSAVVCVRVNSFQAGAIAGECMRLTMEKNAEAAVLIGSSSAPDHLEKIKGFSTEFNRSGFRNFCVYETHDISEQAYSITKTLLCSNPNLKGIYVATVNSEAVCRCISELGRQDDIKLVVTDIQPSLAAYVKDGVISATIFQNTILQGRLAAKLLYKTVTSNKLDRQDVLVTPQLVLRSNFDSYLENDSTIGELTSLFV